jgi:hypothetical protein
LPFALTGATESAVSTPDFSTDFSISEVVKGLR